VLYPIVAALAAMVLLHEPLTGLPAAGVTLPSCVRGYFTRPIQLAESSELDRMVGKEEIEFKLCK